MAKKNKMTSGNPFITSLFTADPSAHVFGDRLYVYASRDIDPAVGADHMDRYHVFSTDNMVDWRDEGQILSSDNVPWGRPEGGFMWAPDCAYKDGKYYFYYPHPSESKWNNTWKIGVATSDHPYKGFVDQGYMEGAGGFAMIDPAVFVENDQAYFYYGGGGSHPLAGFRSAELNDDMMSFKTRLRRSWGLWDFHEAAWVFKRNDFYYLIYSDNKKDNNRYRYAMSKGPLGPWKHKGIFLDPVGCETTHGSIVEYKGQWYLFYHNQAISGQGNLRSICVDRVYFNEDGTIKKVKQTKEGVTNIATSQVNHDKINLYEPEGCKSKESDSVIMDDRAAPIQFINVDGGQGGRAQIRFTYASGVGVIKLDIVINDQYEDRINAVSDMGDAHFVDDCYVTVPFEAGMNQVKIVDSSDVIKIKSMEVELLDE